MLLFFPWFKKPADYIINRVRLSNARGRENYAKLKAARRALEQAKKERDRAEKAKKGGA